MCVGLSTVWFVAEGQKLCFCRGWAHAEMVCL